MSPRARRALPPLLLALAAGRWPDAASANSTASWLSRRELLVRSVFGPAGLPSRAVPDEVKTYPGEENAGMKGLVWNISHGLFPITSTVFYA